MAVLNIDFAKIFDSKFRDVESIVENIKIYPENANKIKVNTLDALEKFPIEYTKGIQVISSYKLNTPEGILNLDDKFKFQASYLDNIGKKFILSFKILEDIPKIAFNIKGLPKSLDVNLSNSFDKLQQIIDNLQENLNNFASNQSNNLKYIFDSDENTKKIPTKQFKLEQEKIVYTRGSEVSKYKPSVPNASQASQLNFCGIISTIPKPDGKLDYPKSDLRTQNSSVKLFKCKYTLVNKLEFIVTVYSLVTIIYGIFN